MPTCRELMTREPVCCEPTDAVTRVAELMKKEDVGSVPVVDVDRRVVRERSGRTDSGPPRPELGLPRSS